MSFQRFTEDARCNCALISIWKNGYYGFNKGSIKEYNIKDYSYGILFYNNRDQKVGFRFTVDGTEGGAIKLNIRESNILVYAKKFLDYFSIDYSKSKRFYLEYDDKEDMYVFNLNKEIK